jgi:hypothetical protein
LISSATAAALGATEQEEQTAKEQEREDQAGCRLLPSAWLT